MKIDREWYDIRDMFLGENYTTQNIQLAIERASKCAHPDAEWLTKVFAGKSVQKIDEAKQVFSQCGEDDARALCFTWMLGDVSKAVLKKSAKLGYAFAQAEIVGRRLTKEDQYELCKIAAASAERDAFFELGVWYQRTQNTEYAKKYYKMAVDLGHISAMQYLANLLKSCDPEKWRLWGVCEARGLPTPFLSLMLNQIALHNASSINGAVVFQIGRALNGHINEEKKEIFLDRHNFIFRCVRAKQAVVFYKSQLQACRKAVDAWTIVGMRLHVCKDMRKMVSLLIWNSREEAKY